MIIMPSMNHDSNFTIGPRDLMHALSQVLAGFRGGNPAVLSILQEKLGRLGLSAGSPQRLLELSSPEEEREEWHQRTTSGTPQYLTLIGMESRSPTYPSSMSSNGQY
jgi:hypothetical protein